MNKYSWILAVVISTLAQGAQVRVVATVNDLPITSYEVTQQSNLISVPGEDWYQQTVEALIDAKAVEVLAERAEIEVNEARIDEAIAAIAAGNQSTVSAMMAQIEHMHVDPAFYRQFIKRQILAEDFKRSLVSEAKPTTAEVRAYIEQHQQYTYTFMDVHYEAENPTMGSTNDTIEDIREKLAQKGQLVINEDKVHQYHYSDETADTLPNLFTEALSVMHAGEVSAVLVAPNGYHVLKLEGMQPTHPLSEEEAHEALLLEHLQGAYEHWLEEQKQWMAIQHMPS